VEGASGEAHQTEHRSKIFPGDLQEVYLELYELKALDGAATIECGPTRREKHNQADEDEEPDQAEELGR
jgi:hypothetical protein